MKNLLELVAVVGVGLLLMMSATNRTENKYELGYRDGKKTFDTIGREEDPKIVFARMLAYGVFHGERRRKGYEDGYIMALEDYEALRGRY